MDVFGDPHWPLIPLPSPQPLAIYPAQAGGAGTAPGGGGTGTAPEGGRAAGSGPTSSGGGEVGGAETRISNIAGQAYLVPRFSGYPEENVENFVEALSFAKFLGGWSDEQALAVARLRLDGLAADYVRANNAVAGASWENLKSALRLRFGPHLPRFTVEQRFITCVQQPTETVNQYATRLQLLSRHLEQAMVKDNGGQKLAPGVIADRVLHQFLSGLRRDLRRFVLIRSPKDMVAALAAATAEEEAEGVAMGVPPQTHGTNTGLRVLGAEGGCHYTNPYTASPYTNMQQANTQSHAPVTSHFNFGPPTQAQPVNSNYSGTPYPNMAYTNTEILSSIPQQQAPTPAITYPQPSNSYVNSDTQNQTLPHALQSPAQYQSNQVVQSQTSCPQQQTYDNIPQTHSANHVGNPSLPRVQRDNQSRCHLCNEPNHLMKNCPYMLCAHCGLSGHRPKNCRKNRPNNNQGKSNPNSGSKNGVGPTPPPLPR